MTLPVLGPLSSAMVTVSLPSVKSSLTGETVISKVETSVLSPSVRVYVTLGTGPL